MAIAYKDIPFSTKLDPQSLLSNLKTVWENFKLARLVSSKAYYTSAIPAKSSFSELASDIDDETATIFVNSTVTISANLTIPSNISIVRLEGGGFTSSNASTLTINGPFSSPLSQAFFGDLVVVFGKPPNLSSFWWGAVGDGSTNDASAIQKAINAANESGGGVVELAAKNHFCGTTTIEWKSNVKMFGHGPYSSTLSWSASSGDINPITVAAGVTKFAMQGFGVTGYMGSSPVATNSSKGIKISGTKFRIHDLYIQNNYYGIVTDKTAQWGRIYDIDFENTSGQTQNAVDIRSSKNIRAWNINIIGIDDTDGFNHGVVFQNGGTIHGARFCRITGVDSYKANAFGAGTYVDNFVATGGANANYNYKNLHLAPKVWTLTSQAGGYTSAVAGDIGLVVIGATSDARAILTAYDNGTRIWTATQIGETAFTGTEAISIQSGTGAGTLTTATSAGYTDCVSGDLGKTVTGATSGATGTLQEYDNAEQVWCVLPVNGTVFQPGESLSIGTGTGAGSVDRKVISIALVAGFTAFVASDIGKTISGGTSSASGILLEYNNSIGRVVVKMTANTAFVGAETLSVSAGTGTGTSDGSPVTFFNPVVESPACTDSFINENACSDTINTTLGSGVVVDGAQRSIAAFNVMPDNNYCGMFIGDNPNNGSVVSMNIAAKNRIANFAITNSNNMIISGNNSDQGFSSGYRVEPTISGACDRMILSSNLDYKSGVTHTGDLDVGMALTGEQVIAIGNGIFQSYRHGMSLTNSKYSAVIGNLIGDSDNNKTGLYSGIFADGATLYSSFLANVLQNALGTNRASYGMRFTANAKDNFSALNNISGAKTANYSDIGGRNALNSNFGDSTDPMLLTQVADAEVVDLQYTTGIGFLWVFESVSNSVGCFLITGSGNTVTEVIDPLGKFNATAANAGTCNVYYSSGYKLENNLGSTANFKIFLMGSN